MKFVDMLMRQVATPKPPSPTTPKGSNKERFERALENYKKALPNGVWMGTHDIARKAGVAHSTAVTMLRAFYGKGLLERRGRGTYEWRWIK